MTLQKDRENNIILCAGSINYLDIPMITSLSMAMIPVNGKPVIGWILDDLLTKGIYTATVVMKYDDDALLRFISSAYSGRLSINVKRLKKSESILTSLQAGLEEVPDARLVRIILGDTLIRDTFINDDSFAYASKVEMSSRWCVIRTNENDEIIDYVDKPEKEIQAPLILSGYYHMINSMWLKQCVDQALAEGERELSKVLSKYSEKYPIKAVLAKEWFDFGHIDTLVSSRQKLLQARYFNSLKVDPLYHTVTKISQNNDKLDDELNWYLLLPEELKVLCPRIVRYSRSDSREISITQEYYGYPTLAELYVYSDLRKDTWTSILKILIKLHNEFRKYRDSLERHHVFNMYFTKTEQRLDTLRKQKDEWANLLSYPEITVNEKKIKNLPLLWNFIEQRSHDLSENASISIIHGDYCLSNILFDINSQIVRLIDPRGSFGAKGIYGDPRYDLAKLRHSICELYDFIVADMFDLSADADFRNFSITIYCTELVKGVSREFDKLVVENGYSLEEIKFIEALLFLSMIPLHKGKPLRQQLMYITGIKLLNEIVS